MNVSANVSRLVHTLSAIMHAPSHVKPSTRRCRIVRRPASGSGFAGLGSAR